MPCPLLPTKIVWGLDFYLNRPKIARFYIYLQWFWWNCNCIDFLSQHPSRHLWVTYVLKTCSPNTLLICPSIFQIRSSPIAGLRSAMWPSITGMASAISGARRIRTLQEPQNSWSRLNCTKEPSRPGRVFHTTHRWSGEGWPEVSFRIVHRSGRRTASAGTISSCRRITGLHSWEMNIFRNRWCSSRSRYSVWTILIVQPLVEDCSGCVLG